MWKDLANYKVQLEAKNAAHMQALLKLEHSQKMIRELSTLLKNSDSERNKYMNECEDLRARIDELESEMKEMDHQQSENAKVRGQLSHVLSELKATQRELLNKETELVAARDSEVKALARSEEMETACNFEREKKEELLQKVRELNEKIDMSRLAAIEAEKEKLAILSEKDQKIELAQRQVEDLRNQIETLLANEALVSSAESASNATKDSNQFHTDMEVKDGKMMEALEMELNQLKHEHNDAIESLTGDLQKAKAEISMLNESNVEAQVENALLISQLQEFRSIFSDVVEVSEERNDKNDNKDHMTIPLKEYESMVKEAEKTREVQASEAGILKKELEVATAKIRELRARAEQAISRAELAEKAKEALEDKFRRYREHRQRRRGAITALQEESTTTQNSPSSSDGTPKIYQPLGKVLNMRF